MANIFRGPLIAPISRKGFLAPDVIPNLLLTTLAVVAVAPFNQDDWPTPSRAKVLPQAECYSSTFALGIPPPPPNNQDDWPTPLRAKIAPQADSQSGVTTRGIPRTPFTPVEGPQMVRARFLPPEVAPNLLLGTLAPVVSVPFANADWPNPVIRRVWQDFSHNGTTTRGIPPPPPFNQDDQPNPVGQRGVRFDDPPNLLPILSVVPVAPFNQDDWPVPLRARNAPQAESSGGVGTRGIPPPPPFAQRDWPLPLRARTTPYGEFVNAAPLGVLSIAPTVLPFGLDDWPVPARIRPARLDRWEITNLLQSTLAPVVFEPAPQLVGLTEPAALAILQNDGLVLGTVAFASSTQYAVGVISSQNPIFGTPVQVGSAINIVLSSGPPSPVVTPIQAVRRPNLPNEILPPPTKLVDERGVMAPNWWRFLLNVSQAALGTSQSQPATVTISASPAVVTTPVQGSLIVAGGPVSLIEYSKDGQTWFPTGQTQGIFQLVPNDLVRITYTNPPAVTFFPR